MNQCYGENNFCSSVQIIQTSDKTFFTRLFYAKTGEPFDLTGATEILALFPGANNTPVKKSYSDDGGITIMGSPGAGKIQIALTSTDTAAMQPNPQVGQNLQIIATIDGVSQVDNISFGSPPVSETTYTVTLNGVPFSYKALLGDNAQDVFDVISLAINAAGLLLSSAVSGTLDSAVLSVTSSTPGLGFTDSVSSGMTLVNAVANSGVRTIFLLQQVLMIQPQDYEGD